MADQQEIKLVFRITDDGTLTVLDQAGRKLGELGEQAEKTGRTGTEWFGNLGAAAIVANQAFELVSRAYHVIANSVQEFTAHASEQDRAEAALNATLRASGQLTTEYAGHLLDLSEATMHNTTVADESALGVERQLVAFGASRDNIEQLTAATLDLSEGMGRDLGGATLVMGKALAGEFGTLSRYGILIDQNASGTEKLQQVIDQVALRFGGQAAAAAQTFQGRLAQLGNETGEVLEELGFMVTRSDAAKDGVQRLTLGVGSVAEQIHDWVTANRALIDQHIEGFFSTVEEAAKAIPPTLETGVKLFGALYNFAKPLGPALTEVATAIGRIAEELNKVPTPVIDALLAAGALRLAAGPLLGATAAAGRTAAVAAETGVVQSGLRQSLATVPNYYPASSSATGATLERAVATDAAAAGLSFATLGKLAIPIGISWLASDSLGGFIENAVLAAGLLIPSARKYVLPITIAWLAGSALKDEVERQAAAVEEERRRISGGQGGESGLRTNGFFTVPTGPSATAFGVRAPVLPPRPPVFIPPGEQSTQQSQTTDLDLARQLADQRTQTANAAAAERNQQLQLARQAAPALQAAAEAQVTADQSHLTALRAQLDLAKAANEPFTTQRDITNQIVGAEKQLASDQISQLEVSKLLVLDDKAAVALIDAKEAAVRRVLDVNQTASQLSIETTRREAELEQARESATVARAQEQESIAQQDAALLSTAKASDNDRLAAAERLDAAHQQVLQTQRDIIAAQLDHAAALGLSDEQVIKLGTDLELANDRVNRGGDAVRHFTAELQGARHVTIDLGTSLESSVKRATDALLTRTGGLDFGELLKGTGQAMASEFIAGLVSAELRKGEFDAKITDNFTVKLPGIFKQGADALSSVWSDTLDLLGIHTERTTSSIGDSFTGLFSNVSSGSQRLSDTVDLTVRNSSGFSQLTSQEIRNGVTLSSIPGITTIGTRALTTSEINAGVGGFSTLGGGEATAANTALPGAGESAAGAGGGAALLGSAGLIAVAALLVKNGITSGNGAIQSRLDAQSVTNFNPLTESEGTSLYYRQFGKSILGTIGLGALGGSVGGGLGTISNATGGGAGGGAAAGATYGAILGPLGIGIGVIIGAIVGALQKHIPTLEDQYGNALNKIFDQAGIPRAANFKDEVYNRPLADLQARSANAPAIKKVLEGSDAPEYLRAPVGPPLSGNFEGRQTTLFGSVEDVLNGGRQDKNGTFGFFTNTFVNNARALNLDVSQTQQQFLALAASLNLTLESGLQKLGDAFQTGGIPLDRYEQDVKNLITLFSVDLPAGVDISAVAQRNFAANGSLDMKKFNQDLQEQVQLYSDLQQAQQQALQQNVGAALTNTSAIPAAVANQAAQAAAQASPGNTELFNAALATDQQAKTALQPQFDQFRTSVEQSIVGGVTGGLSLALQDTDEFKALNQAVADAVTAGIAGGAIDMAQLTGTIDAFEAKALPMVEASLTAIRDVVREIENSPVTRAANLVSAFTQGLQLATAAYLAAISQAPLNPTTLSLPGTQQLTQPLPNPGQHNIPVGTPGTIVDVIATVTADQNALLAFKQQMQQAIVGAVQDALTQGIVAALQGSTPFKAMTDWINGTINDALAGKTVSTAGFLGRVDTLLNASLPALELAAEAERQLAQKVAILPTNLEAQGQGFADQAAAARFGLLNPRQQDTQHRDQVAADKAQIAQLLTQPETAARDAELQRLYAEIGTIGGQQEQSAGRFAQGSAANRRLTNEGASNQEFASRGLTDLGDSIRNNQLSVVDNTTATKLNTAQLAAVHEALTSNTISIDKLIALFQPATPPPAAGAITHATPAGIKALTTAALTGHGTRIEDLINIANIPHFASGGMVERPTVALIGERGPEAVIPLSNGGRMDSGLVATLSPHLPAFAAGGIVTTPTLAIIGERGPEAVVPLTRSTGRGAAGGDSPDLVRALEQIAKALAKPSQITIDAQIDASHQPDGGELEKLARLLLPLLRNDPRVGAAVLSRVRGR